MGKRLEEGRKEEGRKAKGRAERVFQWREDIHRITESCVQRAADVWEG